MNQNATPALTEERATVLDALRGFALLGICIANAATFSLYSFQAPETLKNFPTATPDTILTFFTHAFIEGKFYSIFSLLFGIGFSIILTKTKSKVGNALLLFYRRLFILLLFGLAHSFLLWDGDILFFYAIAGMFLPLFRNTRNTILLKLIIILLLSPLIFDMLKILSDGQWNLSTPFLEQAKAIDKKYGIEGVYPGNWLIEHDTYKELRNWSHSGFWWGWYLRVDGNRIVKVFAMFLLGLYVGRNQWYKHLEKHKALLKRIQIFGLALGIPSGIAFAWFAADKKSLPDPNGIWDTIMYTLNVAPLAMGYAATMALWYVNGRFQNIFARLQPVGRMALTNYIMQSIMGVFIYYGFGWGMGGKFGPAGFIPIAIIIFLIQVLYSNVWFNYFHYGPLEWVWRQLTYGKRLPLKK